MKNGLLITLWASAITIITVLGLYPKFYDNFTPNEQNAISSNLNHVVKINQAAATEPSNKPLQDDYIFINHASTTRKIYVYM